MIRKYIYKFFSKLRKQENKKEGNTKLNNYHRIGLDTTYIVEFPKSGITYLSWLIANVVLDRHHEKKDVTFFNVDEFVCDEHMFSRELFTYKSNEFGSFVKTHSLPLPYHRRVIYLMRNPLDTMVSYFNYCGLEKWNGDFTRFLNDSNYGISAYLKHVESWLGNDRAIRAFVLRYEDLVSNPLDCLRQIFMNCFGIQISNQILQNAVDRSTKEKMNTALTFYYSKMPIGSVKRYTIDKSDKNFRKSEITTEQLNLIINMCSTSAVVGHYYPELEHFDQ